VEGTGASEGETEVKLQEEVRKEEAERVKVPPEVTKNEHFKDFAHH
jgi:hypothetical protein